MPEPDLGTTRNGTDGYVESVDDAVASESGFPQRNAPTIVTVVQALDGPGPGRGYVIKASIGMDTPAIKRLETPIVI